MRIVFGALSLLVVVAIVGVLAKKQLGVASNTATAVPAVTSGSPVTMPAGTPQQQVHQVQQAVEGALQQARPMPTDDK